MVVWVNRAVHKCRSGGLGSLVADLIDVHVGLGAAPSATPEAGVVGVLASGDGICCLADQLFLEAVQEAMAGIHRGAGTLIQAIA